VKNRNERGQQSIERDVKNLSGQSLLALPEREEGGLRAKGKTNAVRRAARRRGVGVSNKEGYRTRTKDRAVLKWVGDR